MFKVVNDISVNEVLKTKDDQGNFFFNEVEDDFLFYGQ